MEVNYFMGRQKKGAVPVILAVLTIGLLGIGFTVSGTMTDVGPFSLIDSGEEDPTTQTQTQTSEKLEWADHELPLDVVAPVASDFEVTAFNAEPHEDGEYGDYADFNSSDATSGLTAGVGYYQETGTDTKTVTFPANLKLPSGETLQFAIVDTASTQEYHPAFVDADVPSEVSEIDYDNGNSKTLIGSDSFKRKPSVKSDAASIEEINGETAEYADYEGSSTNLDAAAYDSETGETATLERTIELDHGYMALGEVDVANVSDDLTSGEVEIYYTNSEGNKETIFDKTVAEDGSEDTDVDMEIPTDLGDDESVSENPEWVNKELHIEYTMEFDGSSVSADEELLSVGLKNIYGDYVGTSDTVAALA